jgi:hypothetical protein
MSMKTCERVLTLGELSLLLGISEGKLRRLLNRCDLPLIRWCGGRRVFLESDVPKLRTALAELGLPPATEGIDQGSFRAGRA